MAVGTGVPVDGSNVVATSQGGSTLQKNMSGSKYAIYFWAGLVGIFLLFGLLQEKNKSVREELQPANLKANFHNVILITLAAVVGINGLYVLLAKLAAMSIPYVSSFAGSILPLFSV
jgi:hypothetical protein